MYRESLAASAAAYFTNDLVLDLSRVGIGLVLVAWMERADELVVVNLPVTVSVEHVDNLSHFALISIETRVDDSIHKSPVFNKASVVLVKRAHRFHHS